MMMPTVAVTSSQFIDRDNKGKWLEVYRIANQLLVTMELWRDAPSVIMRGDEFEAYRQLLSFIMASSGHHIDAVVTATTQEQLFDILREFLAAARSRC